MKHLAVVIFCVLVAFPAAARLRIDAGVDTVWCMDFRNLSGPRLGGPLPVSGGVAPYRYQWKTSGRFDSARFYLDSTNIARPLLKALSIGRKSDSATFVLQVTDARGNVGMD